MITPRARKWFWGSLIGINSGMILLNCQLGLWDWAFVNFLSALGCWVGFFIADRDYNKEKENGD